MIFAVPGANVKNNFLKCEVPLEMSAVCHQSIRSRCSLPAGSGAAGLTPSDDLDPVADWYLSADDPMS